MLFTYYLYFLVHYNYYFTPFVISSTNYFMNGMALLSLLCMSKVPCAKKAILLWEKTVYLQNITKIIFKLNIGTNGTIYIFTYV